MKRASSVEAALAPLPAAVSSRRATGGSARSFTRTVTLSKISGT